MYEKLKKVQDLLWRQDDIVSQNDMEIAKELLADILLDIAIKEGKQKKLIQDYPWLYEEKNEKIKT